MSVRGGDHQGIRGRIFKKKHRDRMGMSIWLYGWLCARQTKANGLVHGGKSFTYRIISDDMGESIRTIEGWMAILKRERYILVKYTVYKKMVIYILNQKKFRPKQGSLFEKESKSYPASQRDKKNVSDPVRQRDMDPAGQRDHVRQPAGFKHEVTIEKRAADGISSLSAFEVLGIPVPTWFDFVKMRERIHRPIVNGAQEIIFRELESLRALGSEPILVIEQAISTSSFRLYPVGGSYGGNRNGESFHEKRSRTTLNALANVFAADIGRVASKDGGTLPAADQRDQRKLLSAGVGRSVTGRNGRGLSACDSDIGIPANGCDDPECIGGNSEFRGNTIDVHPIRGDRSGGSGVYGGGAETNRRDESEAGNSGESKADRTPTEKDPSEK
jgi:hypothetical protein